MSRTEIYAVRQGEPPIKIGECHNAWRGAMYVWNDISQRYFGFEYFPMEDEDMRSRVWNAHDEKPLSRAEVLVLASTMDNAIVKKEDFVLLLSSFDEYGKIHDGSSLSEQSKIISSSYIPDGYAIAWLQTSVSECWFEVYDYEEDTCTCDLSKAFDATKTGQEDNE